MDENTIVEFDGRAGLSDPLNDLLKKGAETLLGAAIEAEVEALLAGLKDCPERRMGVRAWCEMATIRSAQFRLGSGRSR